VRVTQADVDETNRKAAGAFGALVSMWTKEFGRVGEEFATPRLARYRGAVRTPCGVIAPSNASYCLLANTVYYDDVFLAAQAKVAGQALNSDGDMAAVGIIAHEMGHAVAMQLGFRARDSYSNEAVADCLAGAFARQSATDGALDDGDIDEAFFGMASAGDPTPQATGDAERDRRVARLIARNSHGSREQRMGNFREGLDAGSGACLSHFSAAS
jgi:predicted metalloprotease